MEEPELSTADFIKEAAAAGFSIKDLNQAEIELRESEICNTSPNSSAVGNSYLAKKIVDTMVQRKVRSRISPWRGPLPKPRVSPQRTFGDALAKAYSAPNRQI